MKKSVFDLFCGGGGFSLRAASAGVADEFYGFDSCSQCLKVYELNIPNSYVTQLNLGTEMSKTILIQKILSSKNEYIHVHASPPCQNLSQLNRDRPTCNGVRLLEWSLEFIKEVKELRQKRLRFPLKKLVLNWLTILFKSTSTLIWV